MTFRLDTSVLEMNPIHNSVSMNTAVLI